MAETTKQRVSKRELSELAVLGGPPAFSEPLHVGRPNIAEPARALSRIADVLASRLLTNDGVHVQSFERAVAQQVGVRNCVAMCNATVALGIVARALGLHGEVIVPAFTFVATPHALQWQGLTPVFCDIRPDTHGIDPLAVERMITPRTSGILAVHLWGHPCDVKALEGIAQRHGLALLFDAAHAFGCTHGDKPIGGFGDAEVFSFHATKIVNAFEGGAVTTDNDELAGRLRLMRNFGFAGLDTVVHLGVNGKMTEVSAAMGLVNLESLERFRTANRANMEAYRAALAGIPGVRLLTPSAEHRSNMHYVVVEIDPGVAAIDRDTLLDVLWAENVRARRYFHPGCHRMEPYRSMRTAGAAPLPVTEAVADRTLVLPTGEATSPTDIAEVCAIIGIAVRSGPRLAAAGAIPRWYPRSPTIDAVER